MPCIEDMPDENFWEMLNGESNLMNIASETDIDDHFASEILSPPFDPYVKPSDVETMSAIDLLVAESESVFGVDAASKEAVVETAAAEPQTESRMDQNYSRLPRMQELRLTPIHFESERLIGADTSSPAVSGLNASASEFATPPVKQSAPSLTDVLITQQEPKIAQNFLKQTRMPSSSSLKRLSGRLSLYVLGTSRRRLWRVQPCRMRRSRVRSRWRSFSIEWSGMPTRRKISSKLKALYARNLWSLWLSARSTLRWRRKATWRVSS